MGNIYFLMIDQNLEEYPEIKKYLRGRIGANPFFGEEIKHALYGLGIGLIDAHLLASTQLSGNTRLWTQDKRLQAAALRLNLAAPIYHV